MASLDPHCELIDLESQVSAAREAESSLAAVQWADILKHKSAVLHLISHPLLQVCSFLIDLIIVLLYDCNKNHSLRLDMMSGKSCIESFYKK